MRLLLALLTALAGLQDWFVDANAPNCATATGSAADPFCTIAEAITAAADGDTIRIAPGTYVENLTLDEDLELRGTEGEAVTIVDGNQAGSVVTVGAGTTAEIDGLTLRNGRSERGAGILVDSSAVAPLTNFTLSNSTVSGNTAFSYSTARGGGIAALVNSEVTLFRSTLRDNSARGSTDTVSYAYGGLVWNAGNMAVNECTLENGFTYGYWNLIGPAILNEGTLRLSSSLVTKNAYGTFTSTGPLVLRNSTIAGNGTPVVYAGDTTTVRACILWGNFGSVQISDPGYNATVIGSIVQGGWSGIGSNNLDTNPLFVDSANGDFSLQPTSPCIDKGGSVSHTSKGLGGNPRRLDGDLNLTMIADIGAYEFGNVRLDVSGSATPGGTLTFDLTGTPGLTARLVIASAPGELVFFPGGTLFFDLGSPYFKSSPGTLPSTLNLTIPPTIPPGTFSIAQAFVIGPPTPNGMLPLNVSNAVEVVIR